MEERKAYQIIGTVTIGTDEYRDLIEAVKEAEKNAEDADHCRWEYYRKANELEKENEELKKKLEKYEAFTKQDTVKDSFTLFCVKLADD